MGNRLLAKLSEDSGVSEGDIRRVVAALRDPMSGMTHWGDVYAAVPPFAWPEDRADEWSKIFPGWSGLTPGEYENTKAATIWRAMCDRLLDEGEVYDWELTKWPHPVKNQGHE